MCSRCQRSSNKCKSNNRAWSWSCNVEKRHRSSSDDRNSRKGSSVCWLFSVNRKNGGSKKKSSNSSSNFCSNSSAASARTRYTSKS